MEPTNPTPGQPGPGLAGLFPPIKKKPWPYIIASVLAVTIVIIFIIVSNKNEYVEGPLDTAMPQEPEIIAEVNKNQNAQPAAPQKTPTLVDVALTYTQAIDKYEGRRIQFNDQCQAQPSAMTVKRGTNIMLDNRGDSGRWIAVDEKRYYLKAFSFAVVTLTSFTLPHTVHINCGSANNVAQILLQR
jgi:hypothetical protein